VKPGKHSAYLYRSCNLYRPPKKLIAYLGGKMIKEQPLATIETLLALITGKQVKSREGQYL